MTYDLTYVSFGGGVQSTALLMACILGEPGFPKIDCAVFADTQDEPQWVYDHLAFMRNWSSAPIVITTVGRLSEQIELIHSGKRKRFVSIPAFTGGASAGMLRRQCTREYKIDPIRREIRKIIGPDRKKRVLGLIGISLDEAHRMSPSRTSWITHEWPLVENRWSRLDCMNYIAKHGVPVPKKSSCVYCPFHSDNFWRDIKRNHPIEFKRAVDFDKSIRNLSRSGVKEPIYLHSSRISLDEIDFNENQLQFEFGNECGGYCGV